MNVFFYVAGSRANGGHSCDPREWRGRGSLFINRASEIFGIQLERKENPRKYSVRIQNSRIQMVD